MTTGRYDHLSNDELVALLERRDATRRYGLVWEREGIEADRATNDDFVVLDLDEALSTPPQDARGWRNLVIEGDNWDVLRALRAAYVGRVRCILIDPPYNTGNQDFVYNDRFVGKQDRYRQSTWLEFLYRRLVLARDLLADDGVILVCINDENRARLDLLMEQVFPGMRIGSFVWRTKDTNNSDKARNWSGVHEHVLVYGGAHFTFLGLDTGLDKFTVRTDICSEPTRLDPLTTPKTFINRANTYYPVENPITGLWYPCAPYQVWRFWSETKPPKGKARKEQSMESLIRGGQIHFPAERAEPFFFEDRQALDLAIASGDVPRDGKNRPLLRPELPDLDFWVSRPIAHKRISRIVVQGPEHADSKRPVGSWIAGLSEITDDSEAEIMRSDRQGAATTEIENVFGTKAFDYPKPLSLLRNLVRVTTSDDDIVLDFFAGSGTTAHACLAQDVEDEGRRRFMVVSSSEATSDDPNKNICRDICAQRIRRVISGYGDTPGLGGDYAYLRARRIPWISALYETDPPSIWTLVQLAYDRPLAAFKINADVQVSSTSTERPDEPALAYVCRNTEDALATIRSLAAAGPVTLFSAAPGALRDRLGMPELSIEAVPDRLLAEFPQNVLGG